MTRVVEFIRTAWFPLLFLVFTGVILAASRNLSPVAGSIPRTMASITLVLLLAHLVRLAWRSRSEAVSKGDGSSGSASRAEGSVLAWLMLMCLVVWLLGLAPGLTAFCLGILRFRFREGWGFSIVFGLIVGLASQAAFVLLGMPVYGGMLGVLLR